MSPQPETTLRVAVVDYGLGNRRSIVNMCRRAGLVATLASDADALVAADALILPGVGTFDAGMTGLERSGLETVLQTLVVDERKPVLGICLGMQMLGIGSEEGSRQGLGWIDAVTERLPNHPDLKLPHMGWNTILPTKPTALLPAERPVHRFYFMHSYAVRCTHEDDVLAVSSHGDEFHCAVQHDNIWGVQFHPEKSHRFGLECLRGFGELARGWARL